MRIEQGQSRRGFLRATAAMSVGLAGIPNHLAGEPKGQKKPAAGKAEEEVSPAEDLMREHGVLKRVLLVYGEALRRLEAGLELPPEPLADAAKIIRSFIEWVTGVSHVLAYEWVTVSLGSVCHWGQSCFGV